MRSGDGSRGMVAGAEEVAVEEAAVEEAAAILVTPATAYA